MYSIKHLFHIDASNEEVYKALTTIDCLSNWWTEQTSGNTELESVIEFRFGKQYFNIIKVVTLTETKAVQWQCIDGPQDWINTVISFELDTNENKT